MSGRREGDVRGWLRRGACFDCRLKECLLQSPEGSFELDHIEALVLSCECRFDLLRDQRMRQEAFVGRLGLVVAAGELASLSELLFELHDRLEEVGVQA